MPFTSYFDALLVGTIFGRSGYVPPTTLYVALSTSSPTQAAANGWNFIEPTGGGYGRASIVATAWSAPTSQPAAGATVANSATITFPPSTAAWSAGAVIGYVGVWDALTAGNLLAFGQLNQSLTVPGPGYEAVFSPGVLAITNI
jgi:hypothetical protein